MTTTVNGVPLDATDQAILDERMAAFDELDGPRVGDWVDMPDGTHRRIAYHWGDGIQPSDGAGSFYLGNGYVSMSGSLMDAIPADRYVDTGETRPGPVWFFHHDQWRAHNGVDVDVPLRVFRLREDD